MFTYISVLFDKLNFQSRNSCAAFLAEERVRWKWQFGLGMISKMRFVKLLYKSIGEVKNLTKELYEKIIEKCPIMRQMVELIGKLKEVLKSKEVRTLKGWMVEANSLKIREIERFVKGIKSGIEAVRNAIMYEYNNRLAEGSVNKSRVIKRIMYWRIKFELLKAKVSLLENDE